MPGATCRSSFSARATDRNQAHLATPERLRLFGVEGSGAVVIPERDLVLRLILIMVGVPFFLFALNSFPATGALRRSARPTGERQREAWLLVAIFLRVFQHVFEMAGKMLTAWREENPQLVMPRYREDWKKGIAPRGYFGWFTRSIWAWSVSLLQQSLVFVPIAVRGWGTFHQATGLTSEESEGG